MEQKITVQKVNRSSNKSIKEEIEWICDSLSLSNGRDTEGVSLKIMQELLNLFSKNELISTEEISKNLGIKPYVINHHIRKLMESGIIIRKKRKIALRGGSLSGAIEEMKEDSDAIFNKLLNISKIVEKEINLV
jgi:predicted transcriptional regulator